MFFMGGIWVPFSWRSWKSIKQSVAIISVLSCILPVRFAIISVVSGPPLFRLFRDVLVGSSTPDLWLIVVGRLGPARSRPIPTDLAPEELCSIKYPLNPSGTFSFVHKALICLSKLNVKARFRSNNAANFEVPFSEMHKRAIKLKMPLHVMRIFFIKIN